MITKKIKKASFTKARQGHKKLAAKRIDKKGYDGARLQGLTPEGPLKVLQS